MKFVARIFRHFAFVFVIFSPLRAIDFFYRTFHIHILFPAIYAGSMYGIFRERESLPIHILCFRASCRIQSDGRRRSFTIINCILRENAIKSRHITVISSCLLFSRRLFYSHRSFCSSQKQQNHLQVTTSLVNFFPDEINLVHLVRIHEAELLRHVNGKQSWMLPSQELLHLHEQTEWKSKEQCEHGIWMQLSRASRIETMVLVDRIIGMEDGE